MQGFPDLKHSMVSNSGSVFMCILIGCLFIWLVVWNIFYFPYFGNKKPNWCSYFSEELKPPTSHVYSCFCSVYSKISPTKRWFNPTRSLSVHRGTVLLGADEPHVPRRQRERERDGKKWGEGQPGWQKKSDRTSSWNLMHIHMQYIHIESYRINVESYNHRDMYHVRVTW